MDEVEDGTRARAFGVRRGQITVMIHTGSRGLGHQVCTDYVSLMNRNMARYQITLPDGSNRRILDRLANRITKILSHVRKLNRKQE